LALKHTYRQVSALERCEQQPCTFATFIYEKGSERLLRHITGTDENDVIRQALVWCEQNS